MVERRIAFGETHIFVGRGYVLSVRHGASTSYTPVRERCEASPKALSDGEDFILYAILDFIVDNYMPVIEAIQVEAEEIEDRILSGIPSSVPGHPPLPAAARPRSTSERCRSPWSRFASVSNSPVCPGLTRPCSRCSATCWITSVACREEIESLREVLAFAFETSLMTGQAQQTEVARRLAAWAAILAVPTAVAGIYGMNFEHMPELRWQYGYFLVLAFIVAVCSGLYWRFRRNGWL